MTLTDRLLAELTRLGSSRHPIVRRLPTIINEHVRRAYVVFGLAVVVAFTLGFLTCYTWIGTRMEVLSSNVAAWKDQNDTDWRTYRHGVKVSKAQAQVIVSRKEREP